MFELKSCVVLAALFCDYYNPPGECEWHYKPCGAPCMKTCRNPSGTCASQIPPLEGKQKEYELLNVKDTQTDRCIEKTIYTLLILEGGYFVVAA